MQNSGVILEKKNAKMFIFICRLLLPNETENFTSYTGTIFILWICEDFVNYSGQPVSI